MTFKIRYNASPFDPNDARDARSERARVILVSAFDRALEEMDAQTGEELQDIAGGLLVGSVGVMQALVTNDDATHRAMRDGMIELIPWAMDLIRDMQGLAPLEDVEPTAPAVPEGWAQATIVNPEGTTQQFAWDPSVPDLSAMRDRIVEALDVALAMSPAGDRS